MAKTKGFAALATGALLTSMLAGCAAGEVSCPETLQDDLALISTTGEAATVDSFVEVSPIALPEPSCAFQVNHGGQVIGFWMEKDAAFFNDLVNAVKRAGYEALDAGENYWTNGESILGIGLTDDSGQTSLTSLSGLVNSAAIVMVTPK